MAGKGFEPIINFDEQERNHLVREIFNSEKKKKIFFHRPFLFLLYYFYYCTSKLTRACTFLIEWKILGKESHNRKKKIEAKILLFYFRTRV